MRQELESDVGSSKERVQELQTQLESIVEQLGDARVDKHEDSRRKKKQEIVENFKRLFPGVVSRFCFFSFLFDFYMNFLSAQFEDVSEIYSGINFYQCVLLDS